MAYLLLLNYENFYRTCMYDICSYANKKTKKPAYFY